MFEIFLIFDINFENLFSKLKTNRNHIHNYAVTQRKNSE